LISLADKKSAGMGVPAWGGAKGLPPLFLDLAVIPKPQPSRSVICHLWHSEAGRAEESRAGAIAQFARMTELDLSRSLSRANARGSG
jgi:hypothetical protein